MANKFLESKVRDYSNRELIEMHLVGESLQLNDQQKELLRRWEFADEQIRKHEMKRDTIARLIMFKFKVSRTTAYQDIVSAEAVFASSTPINKKYRIGLRIEFLEMKISELYGMVKMGPEDEEGNKIEADEEDILQRAMRVEGNQEYLHEAKELEKVLQKYYHDYPDMVLPRSPKTIIYNINYNDLPAPNMTVDAALEKASKIIHIKPREISGNDQQSNS